MELQYRKNAPLTGKQVADLRVQCGLPGWEEEFTERIHRAYFTMTCWDNSRLVGFIEAVSNGMTEAWLQDLIIHPNWENQLVGRQLVNHSIMALQEEGICSISLVLPPHLQEFYESMGYELQLSQQRKMQ